MPPTDRAVVIGASMGGLLAAQAVTKRYSEVLLIDRDTLPDVPVPRGGVPQGPHTHVLLARGIHALDELFPGLSAELVARGACPGDLQQDVCWYHRGRLLSRAPSSISGVGVSRPLLEHVVRARVRALPGVRILAGHQAVGLTSTRDGRRITGVRVVTGDKQNETVLHADLVVDAAGRGSRTPAWLRALGHRPAPEERVPVDVTYLTRLYRREPHQLMGLLAVISGAESDHGRSGAIMAEEENGVRVTLCGIHGDRPPADDAGLIAFADHLTAPEIAELLRAAVPLAKPVRMRFPASVRRHYEHLRDFPSGLLVVADALCSFNPIYGQGITVAGLEALALRQLLDDCDDPVLARRFFRAAALLIDVPWTLALTADNQSRGAAQAGRARLLAPYLNRLKSAASVDPALGTAFLRVVNMLDPPARLLAPRTVLRVVRAGRAMRGRTVQRPSTSSIAR